MRRRELLSASGSAILLGSGIIGNSGRPALGVDISLGNSRINRSPSNVDEIVIEFSELKLTPSYLKSDDKLEIKVIVGVGERTKDANISTKIRNGRTIDVSNSIPPVRIDGLKLNESNIVIGSVEVIFSHSDIQKSYNQTITIVDSSTPLSEEFLTDFENTNIGSLPSGWDKDIDGNTNSDTNVVNSRSSNGDRSVKVFNLDTGAPSHVHLFTDSYAPTGDHSYKFDYYVDGNKNNGGTADTALLSNLDSRGSNRNRAYAINFVSNGSKIRANGNNLRSSIYDRWVTVGINVVYSDNKVEFTIDDTSYGPYSLINNGNPKDYPIVDFRVDNYDVWLDNFRQSI